MMNTAQRFVITMFGGGWGRQFAVVLNEKPDGSLRVRKWRQQGKQWTGPLWVQPAHVVNPNATAEMAKTFKADLGAL